MNSVKNLDLKINFVYLIVCSFVLLPLPFDFLFKLGIVESPYSAIIRATILLLLIWAKREHFRINFVLLALAIFIAITAVILAKNVVGEYGTPYLIIKIMAVVCLAVIVGSLININEARLILKIFLVVYAVNAITIVAGAIFGLQIFDAGNLSYRFGYSGLLPGAGNESANLLMILFTAIYLNTFHINYLKIGIRSGYLIFICILMSMLLSGSKLATLYPLVLFISHRLTFRGLPFVALSVSALSTMIYLYIDKLAVIYGYFVNSYASKGLISALLASRDERVVDYDFDFSLVSFLLCSASKIVNVEMDFLTVYFNLGFFGFLMLCVPFIYYLVPKIKSRISLAYSLTLVAMIFFAGHVMESAFLILPLIALSKVFLKYDGKSLQNTQLI
jgi:hypothetical protein